MSTTKGKQGTKGQKQIFEENQSTLSFYFNMALVGTAVHFLINYFLLLHRTSTTGWVFFTVSVLVELATYQFMRYMSRPIRSTDGKAAIVDAGIDINMEGGIGEYCKDVIILSFAVQVLAIAHVYFWWLYALGPAFASYKLWTGLIAPWIFAPGAEDSASEEKKRKKREKKLIVRR